MRISESAEMKKISNSCAFSAIFLFIVAGSVSAEDSQADKFEIPLGAVPHYSDEASAKKACGSDGVVWADRKSGFYYPKFFEDYGKTKYGTYTCHRAAVAADYWSLTPASDGGHKGREFPQEFCTVCS